MIEQGVGRKGLWETRLLEPGEYGSTRQSSAQERCGKMFEQEVFAVHDIVGDFPDHHAADFLLQGIVRLFAH